MTPFKCWRPEDGETVDDAETVRAFDAETAAERYAERTYCGDGDDPFERIAIAVQDGTGERTDWSVSVGYSPTFRATREKEQGK